MTLPLSGTLALSDVNTELGRASTTTISMNETAVRALAEVPSGQISMSNFYGKPTPPPASVAYQGTYTSNSALTTYTYTSAPIGSATSTRVVYVGVVTRGGTVSDYTVNIGGVAATQVSTVLGNSTTVMAIYGRVVSSGTTASISVTIVGGVPTRAAIHVWAAYNVQNPFTQVSTTWGFNSRPINLSTNVTEGSIGLCVAYNNDSTTFTYTGLTENFDSYVSGGSFTCASQAFAVTESPRSMSVTCADTSPVGFTGLISVVR